MTQPKHESTRTSERTHASAQVRARAAHAHAQPHPKAQTHKQTPTACAQTPITPHPRAHTPHMCTGDGHMHARAGPSIRGRARAARLGALSLQIGAGICIYAQARPERVQRGSARKLANRRRHMHARAGPSSRGRAHTARLGPLSLHICCVLNVRAGLSACCAARDPTFAHRAAPHASEPSTRSRGGVQQGAHGTQIGTHWKTWMCRRVPPAKLPLLGFTEVTITPPHRASSVISSPRAGPIARTVCPHARLRVRMPRSLGSCVWLLSCNPIRVDRDSVDAVWIRSSLTNFLFTFSNEMKSLHDRVTP